MKIAFDIGGTNMRVASIIGGDLGKIEKKRTPKDPKEGVLQFAELVRACAPGEAMEAAAGGFPGAVPEGIVRLSPNLPQWEGFALATEFSKALGCSVSMRNDADLATLGEAVYGAGKGKRIVAYIGVGTGVGGGRVTDGAIDASAFSLEPGHQILDMRDKKDVEALVSGRAFEKRFGVHPKDAPREAYVEMTPVLALALYNTIVHWSPEVLILGGSMMNEENGYRLEDIRRALEALPRTVPHLPELRLAEFKDTAGLHGARALLQA